MRRIYKNGANVFWNGEKTTVVDYGDEGYLIQIRETKERIRAHETALSLKPQKPKRRHVAKKITPIEYKKLPYAVDDIGTCCSCGGRPNQKMETSNQTTKDVIRCGICGTLMRPAPKTKTQKFFSKILLRLVS
ncbi:MAG: hypothetical protein HQ539_02020 [Parcubacteria group bacterium]|nr:hypothetical protein [Parcubacteria group bacterium]